MLLQNSGTRLSQLMNTSGFHRNVGEGNKSFNAMSPDPLLSEELGKGSGCARLMHPHKRYLYTIPQLELLKCINTNELVGVVFRHYPWPISQLRAGPHT